MNIFVLGLGLIECCGLLNWQGDCSYLLLLRMDDSSVSYLDPMFILSFDALFAYQTVR